MKPRNIIYIRAISVTLLLLFLSTLVSAQKQRGVATFYSKRATGTRTSSGERIHHDSLTCAHRTYPFGTKLKVTNLNNGKSVIVKVNDRGPFTRGRIIDLSWGAAKAIDMLNKGLASVEIEPYEEIIVPYRAEDKSNIPLFEFNTDAEKVYIKKTISSQE